MSKETFIDGTKTVLDTNRYLELMKCENREIILIKYLEDKIQECKNTMEILEGSQSHRISILQTQIHNYQDILEKVKSGKYV